MQFVGEERTKIQWRLDGRLKRQCEINAVVMQCVQCGGVSPGSIWMEHCGKLSLNSRSTNGRMYLAGRHTRAKAQPAMAPFSEFADALASTFHLAKYIFCVSEELFTGLSKNQRFAHSV